jgi:hypothetical protein
MKEIEYIDIIREYDPKRAEQLREDLNVGHLQETIARYSDDNDDGYYDDRINAVAEGLIDSRNDELKRRDPDMYAELKHMGQI